MQSKNVLNRILALLMCFALVLSYLPGISLAAKAEEAVTEDVSASVSAATDETEAESDLLTASLAYNKNHWSNIPNDSGEDTLSGLTAEKTSECVNGSKSASAWVFKAAADATGSATAQIHLTGSTDLSSHYLMMDVKYVTTGTEESAKFNARLHGSNWGNLNNNQSVTVTPGDWQTVTLIPSEAGMMDGKDVSALSDCALITFLFDFSSTTGAERAIYIDNVRAVKIESAKEDWIKLPVDVGMSNVVSREVVTELSVGAGSSQAMKLYTVAEYGSICFHTQEGVNQGVLDAYPNMTSGILGGWFWFGESTPSGNVTLTYSDWGTSNTVDISFESKGNGWYYGTVDCAAFTTTSKDAAYMGETWRVDIGGLPKRSTIYIDCLTHTQTAIEGLSISYPFNTETVSLNGSPSSGFDAMTFISAKNETESAQLLMTPSFDVTSFELTMNSLVNANGNVIPDDAFEVYVQHYVTYTGSKNGGAQVTNSETGETYWNAEAYKEGTDGTFPDALVPMDAKIEAGENVITSGNNQGIWVNLNVDEDVAPGTYTGFAILTVNGTAMQIPVTAIIRDVTVPEENHVKSSFEISWDQLGYTIHGENTTSMTEANTYYNYLISKRLMPFDHWQTRDNNWYINTKIPELAADPAISSYSLENSVATVTVTPATYDDEGNELTPAVTEKVLDVEAMTTMLTMLIEKNIALAEAGSDLDLFEKAFFYFGNLIDEPRSAEDYAEVNECSAQLDAVKEKLAPMLDAYPQLKESFLNLKHIVTGPNPADDTFNFINAQDYGDVVLTGDDYIYTPQYQWFHTEAQRALYASEEEVWWYGCNHPVAPYPTYQINNPLITSRVLGWMMYDYNIAGHLYWTVNSWGTYDSTAEGGFVVKDFWNGGSSSSPGEGMLIYPGNRYGIDGPIGTIRLESIRESHEDYEYLWLLEDFTGSDSEIATYTAGLYEGVIATTDVTVHHKNRISLLSRLEELSIAKYGATVKAADLPTMPVEEQPVVNYPVDIIALGTGTNAVEQSEVTNGTDTAWKITYTSNNDWIYPVIELDQEYDITDHMLVMDVKVTGLTECRMQLATINGSWSQGYDSTYLTNLDGWNTMTYDLSANATGTAYMSKFSLGFDVPNDTTDYAVYIDNLYLVPLETVEDDWIHVAQDPGDYYKNTTTSFSASMLKAQNSGMSMRVVAPADTKGKFTLNTTDLAPDFTSGTLGAWFYFGDAEPSVNVMVTSSNWKGSTQSAMSFVYGGNGWYYGTLDTSTITFTEDANLVGIIRLTFYVPAGYDGYVDGITFPTVENVVGIEREDLTADWTNLPVSSDASVSIDESVYYAQGSTQSLKVVSGEEEAVVTVDISQHLPDMTDGTLSAWFYFGDAEPSAALSISDGSYTSFSTAFTFGESVDGWYCGTVDTSAIAFDEFDVEDGASAEAVAKLLITVPASSTVYIDCLGFQAAEIVGDDFLANAQSTEGVLQAKVTNGSQSAWKMTPSFGTEHNWAYPTITLDQTYDISSHELTMDVMAVGAASAQINLSTIDGQWISGVTSTALTVGTWQTMTFDLGALDFSTMEKFGLGIELSDRTDDYALYIDNVSLTQYETVQQDWINMNIDAGDSTAEYTLDTEYLRAENSIQSMKIVTGDAESTWTLSPESAVSSGQITELPNMTEGIIAGYFYFGDAEPSVRVQLTSSNWKGSAGLKMTMADAGDGWYYGHLDTSKFYFYDENTDGEPDGTAEAVIRVKLIFPANSTVYVDGLMFPTEIPEEYQPTEPETTEPETTEPETTEPETTVPETEPAEDFLSNAAIAVGQLQSEVTNESETAWKLIPSFGTEHDWSYPTIVLDQSYDTSSHKLTMDVMAVGATEAQINLSTIDGNWISGAVSTTLTVGTWQTMTFDLRALGISSMEKFGLGIKLTERTEDYAIYIDNVSLTRYETVEDDLINMSIDAGESTAGTYERVSDFTKDENSATAMKLTSTADTDAKVSFGVSATFGDNYDMSTGVLSAWFYFGEQTPKATVNFAGNWKASVAAAMSFGTGVDGWYYGKLDLSTITFYEETGTMTDVELLRIWVPAGYEPVYVDYLAYDPNAGTLAEEAQSDMLYGASLAYNTAHWTESNGLSYGKDYLNVNGGNSFQSWGYKASAAAAMSGVAQMNLTQSYDATGKILLFDVKANVATDLKVRFQNSGWSDITTDKTIGIQAGDWSTYKYDPSTLIVDGKDLSDVKLITFTFNFASNTGSEREIYIDNVRLVSAETVEQDWINLQQDAGDWYCNSGAHVTDEKVKAEGSTLAIKATAPADVAGKFAFNTESLSVDMSNGTLGAWFYFGDAEPFASVTFTAGNWKASIPASFSFGEGEDGWYYGTVETAGIEFYETENADGVASDLTAPRRIQINFTAGTTIYVDGLTYEASLADVHSYNLVLEDDLRVNFLVSIDASVAQTAQIKVTVDGTEKLYNVSELTADENGLYQVSAWVAAAQMTEEIWVQVVNGADILRTASYTVRGYADVILADEAYSEYHALVKEMLNYGGKAQNYFGYNAENLANSGIADVEASEVPETTDEMTISGSASGISFYGASLVFQDKIAVRLYFNAESINGLSFTANGEASSAELKGSYYMVEIADILPEDLDQQITVTVTDANGSVLTVAYGPMNYVVRMNAKGSDNLKALLKAMYNYHLAAKALRSSEA